MIASFIDGRVRIRAEALKDPALMDQVLAALGARDGILSATPNPRTGSVLVLYDPAAVSRETLLTAALALEEQLRSLEEAGANRKGATLLSRLRRGESWRGKRNGRLSPLTPRGESALMGALYLLTAVTGFGSRRTHVILGAAFAALAGIHLYDRRRCL